MEPRKLSSSLATLGALLVAIAFFWWLSVFASIPHELRSAAPIGQVLPCLLFTSGFVCAGFQLLGGYSPILLWLGIALLGASWWVTQSRSASSASEKAKSGIDFGRMARSFVKKAVERVQMFLKRGNGGLIHREGHENSRG